MIARAAGLLCSLLPLGVMAQSDVCPPQQALKESAVDDSNASGPYAKGMLWKIERPGASASYLFGTMHLSNRQITRLPPAVALALAKADRFVTETVLDQQAMAYYQQSMFSVSAPNLESLFGQPFRSRLLDLLSQYGFDRETALKLKPWATFTVLARPKPTGGPTLDQLLVAMARMQGKPIHALQAIDELVAALEGLPLEHQREIVIDTACNRELIERQAQELTAHYLDQDLAGMVAVSSRFEPRNAAIAETFTETILDERNEVMLKRLEPHLKQGNVFVAVGALHLAGEEGLLRGLAARGYQVTAVY